MKIVKYIILSVFIIMMNSCEEILEEKPMTDPSPSSFYTTEKGVDALIAGCYSNTRFILGGNNYIASLNCVGSDIFMIADHRPVEIDRYLPLFNGLTGDVQDLWDLLYQSVNWTNNAVKFIPLADDISNTKKNTCMGEARFLRAYYNFFIVQHWGGVHLTLEATEGVETEANKTPVNEWYDAIIEDLELAVDLLPESQPDWGRVTKYTAMHLLAKVLLTDTRSGSPEYQEAASLAEAVITSGKYSLLDDRAAVFAPGNEENKEILWSVQFASDDMFQDRGNRAHLWFITNYTAVPGLTRVLEYGRDQSFVVLTPFYMTLFNPESDSRYYDFFQHVFYCNKKTSTLNIGDTALYFPPYTDSWTQEQKDAVNYFVDNYDDISGLNNRLAPSLLKHHDPTRPSVNTNQGKKDIVILRLAETYLLAAEAYWRLNNKPKVLENINVVRMKAALPGKEDDMKIIDWPDGDLDNLILDERARELGGEFHRWFDLKRFGMLIERVKAHHPFAGENIQEYHLLRPIPFTTINLLSNDYPQNPGYDN